MHSQQEVLVWWWPLCCLPVYAWLST